MRGNFLYKRFGSTITKTRKRQGLSQEELSARSHIDRTFVGKIEQGKANPSLKTILKLSRGLRVRMSDLLENI